jgi:hypothetical protein
MSNSFVNRNEVFSSCARSTQRAKELAQHSPLSGMAGILIFRSLHRLAVAVRAAQPLLCAWANEPDAYADDGENRANRARPMRRTRFFNSHSCVAQASGEGVGAALAQNGQPPGQTSQQYRPASVILFA